MHGSALDQQRPAQRQRTVVHFVRRQVLLLNAVITIDLLVQQDLPAMAAGYHLHRAGFHRCVDQGNPEIEHTGFIGVAVQVAQILVPGHHRLLLVGQLRTNIVLRVCQNLRAEALIGHVH